MAKGYNHHPFRSPDRNVGVAMVRFNTVAGVPTITNDDANLCASVANGGVGIYTLTLNQQYRRVRAIANMTDTDPTAQCKVVAPVEGMAATNTITVHCEQENAVSGISALFDPAAEEIDVLIFLKQN